MLKKVNFYCFVGCIVEYPFRLCYCHSNSETLFFNRYHVFSVSLTPCLPPLPLRKSTFILSQCPSFFSSFSPSGTLFDLTFLLVFRLFFWTLFHFFPCNLSWRLCFFPVLFSLSLFLVCFASIIGWWWHSWLHLKKSFLNYESICESSCALVYIFCCYFCSSSLDVREREKIFFFRSLFVNV